MFEELQLADFGNRIPSLTFEVEADAGPVAIGRIAAELSGDRVVAGESPSVNGYAATGDTVRAAISALADAVPLPLFADGDRLVLGQFADGIRPIPPEARVGHLEMMRSADTPACVTLSYYDVDRDYQTGTQRASRPEGSQRTKALPLPAALDAVAAKSLAEGRLASDAAARASARVRLGWSHLPLKPGSLAQIGGETGVWTVRRWQLGPGIVDLELTRVPDRLPVAAAAAPGRSIEHPDLTHGPTELRVFEAPLPAYRDALWLFAAAAGPSPGWRRAALLVSNDGGATWDEAGATAEPAILGHSLNAPAGGHAALFDERSSVEVELLNDAMWLENRSDDALGAGGNLALLGSELIQFGRAEPLGDRRFRLSRLLRGRLGTEWAATGHAAGESFVLVRPGSVAPVKLPLGAIGATALVTAAGIGDSAEGVQAERQVAGDALRPPSPVHLTAAIDAGGALLVTWVRRSRLGFEWANGADAPLGEERERYSVSVAGPAAVRSFEVAEQRLVYPGSEQLADGMSPPLTISVAQIGTYAMSRPAVLALG